MGISKMIDQSLLTIGVYLIAVIWACTVNYKKYQLPIRTVLIFVWISSIYFLFSCCILPIPLSKNTVYPFTFQSQFSVVTFVEIKRYFLLFLMRHMAYFASFFVFAFVNYLLYQVLRKASRACILVLALMAVHLVYNIAINCLVNAVIKVINAEDFIFMFVGYWVGWLCAYVTILLAPKLDTYIFKK